MGTALIQSLEPAQKIKELEDKYKRESFAHRYANGVPMNRALREAGFSPSRDKGVKLLQDPAVMEIIEADLNLLRDSLLNRREALIAELDMNRDFAYEQENAAAAVAATVAKARILGYLDKDAKAPAKITIEWDNAAGDVANEKVYEKSSPLEFDALKMGSS